MIKELRLLSSYTCNTNTTLEPFTGSDVDEVIQVSLSVGQQRVQAFKFSSETDFDEGTNVQCGSMLTPLNT